MKTILLIILSAAFLVSCKKKDVTPNTGACCMFLSVTESDVPTYRFKYLMQGNEVHSKDQYGNPVVIRNVSSVYSNRSFRLDTYLFAPLSKADSLVK